jgi:hypothetical protein
MSVCVSATFQAGTSTETVTTTTEVTSRAMMSLFMVRQVNPISPVDISNLNKCIIVLYQGKTVGYFTYVKNPDIVGKVDVLFSDHGLIFADGIVPYEEAGNQYTFTLKMENDDQDFLVPNDLIMYFYITTL